MYPSIGTCSISRMATRPSLLPSQRSSALGPWPVIAPTPVTTTRMGSLIFLNTFPPLGGTHEHRDVLAFESARERERLTNLDLPGLARHPVDSVARRIGMFEIEGRRHGPVVDRERGDGRVECARAADQVTGRRLDAARNELAVATEDGLHGARLAGVALLRPASVCRDVVDAVVRCLAFRERAPHRLRQPAPLRIGRDQGVRVVRAP